MARSRGWNSTSSGYRRAGHTSRYGESGLPMETDLPTEETTTGEQESHFDLRDIEFGIPFHHSEEATFDLEHLMKSSRRREASIGNDPDIANENQESEYILKPTRPPSCDMIPSVSKRGDMTHRNRTLD